MTIQDFCPLLVNNHPASALADSGAQKTILSTDFVKRLGIPITPGNGKIDLALAGCSAQIQGYATIDITTTAHHLRQCNIMVANLPSHIQMYLGMDIFPLLGIKLVGLPTEHPAPFR